MKRQLKVAILAVAVLAVTVLGARLDAQSPHDAIQKFFQDYFEARLNDEPAPVTLRTPTSGTIGRRRGATGGARVRKIRSASSTSFRSPAFRKKTN